MIAVNCEAEPESVTLELELSDFPRESRTSLFPASAALEGNWGNASSWAGKTNTKAQ